MTLNLLKIMERNKFKLYNGDCLEILKTLEDNSIDSVVADPPYGISFMGKKWDYDVPSVEIWKECLRVLKPGGHLLAFAGTRTQHRMAVRIEDAGFEIRDMIAWVYGSGFPKSLDVSKAIDKAAGAEREVVGLKSNYHSEGKRAGSGLNQHGVIDGSFSNPDQAAQITAPATEPARQWQGWGTALKPALEPITVARKPLVGTVAANVLEHGTGALNIDGCRVDMSDADAAYIGERIGGFNATKSIGGNGAYSGGETMDRVAMYDASKGRWPANLIHDGSDEVIEDFPYSKSGSMKANTTRADQTTTNSVCYGVYGGNATDKEIIASEGSAARFFYSAKASKSDRNEGCENLIAKKYSHDGRETPNETAYQRNNSVGQNFHPTVKPTTLMQYLCRLVTPPNGIVLDPFMGSGSTGKAAMLEGFRFIGIERDESYMEIAEARINFACTGNIKSKSIEKSVTIQSKENANLDEFF